MMRKFFGWFGTKSNPKTDSLNMMASLINKLAITEEHEISCDDVHELLDQYTELKMRGENVEQLLPLVKRHLELCPDCREEHEVLILALQYESHMDEL
jgi:hypothetical protein